MTFAQPSSKQWYFPAPTSRFAVQRGRPSRDGFDLLPLSGTLGRGGDVKRKTKQVLYNIQRHGSSHPAPSCRTPRRDGLSAALRRLPAMNEWYRGSGQ